MDKSVKSEPIWHVELAVLLAIFLQVFLAQELTVGPKYIIAILELLLLGALRLAAGSGPSFHRFRRSASLLLTGLVSIVNIGSLFLVLNALVGANNLLDGKQLLISSIGIFITNIIIFGLWYWQLDGGGAGGRGTHQPPIDFLFPQTVTDDKLIAQQDWQPTFFDYLYVSITNATAFSPTDTMPLSHRAKFLMSIQGLTSLLTVALVAARAINILG